MTIQVLNDGSMRSNLYRFDNPRLCLVDRDVHFSIFHFFPSNGYRADWKFGSLMSFMKLSCSDIEINGHDVHEQVERDEDTLLERKRNWIPHFPHFPRPAAGPLRLG